MANPSEYSREQAVIKPLDDLMENEIRSAKPNVEMIRILREFKKLLIENLENPTKMIELLDIYNTLSAQKNENGTEEISLGNMLDLYDLIKTSGLVEAV